MHLDSSSGDEEPLVDAAVDRSGRHVTALWDVAELAWVDAVWGCLVGNVGTSNNVSRSPGEKNKLRR